MESKTTEVQEVAELKAWLDAFALFVREERYEDAAALFADDVVAFGTVADSMQGLPELMQRQWRHVWSNTQGFHFENESLTCDIAGQFAWVAATWSSQRNDAGYGMQNRPGRATFVLKRVKEGWIAIHSHLSLNPSYLRAELAGRPQDGRG